MFATHDTPKNPQARAIRRPARQVPVASRPLYRHARAALQVAVRQMGVTCLTRSDDSQALLCDLMRLEHALSQTHRFQVAALRRRGQGR